MPAFGVRSQNVANLGFVHEDVPQFVHLGLERLCRGEVVARLGVLGPTRMDYPGTIAGINFKVADATLVPSTDPRFFLKVAGEDVPAQISAINNFIDSGYDAIVVNAQNPTAFAPVIKRAKDAGVMIVPDPPLARALYASVEVGRMIPEELYELENRAADPHGRIEAAMRELGVLLLEHVPRPVIELAPLERLDRAGGEGPLLADHAQELLPDPLEGRVLQVALALEILRWREVGRAT